MLEFLYWLVVKLEYSPIIDTHRRTNKWKARQNQRVCSRFCKETTTTTMEMCREYRQMGMNRIRIIQMIVIQVWLLPIFSIFNERKIVKLSMLVDKTTIFQLVLSPFVYTGFFHAQTLNCVCACAISTSVQSIRIVPNSLNRWMCSVFQQVKFIHKIELFHSSMGSIFYFILYSFFIILNSFSVFFFHLVTCLLNAWWICWCRERFNVCEYLRVLICSL